MLNQSFIELGAGYGDVFELIALMKSNQERLHRTYIFINEDGSGKQKLSLAAAFLPAENSRFMPVYICREGILQSGSRVPERKVLFTEAAKACGQEPVSFTVKPSSAFGDVSLYYQYLTGVLRLNHLLPPLQ